MDAIDDPFAGGRPAAGAAPARQASHAILVDFHGEATSEKMSMGHFCDGRVSAVIGTHSHVPTADAQILPNGTAYMTDAGMCGDYDSVIGMQKQAAIARFVRKMPGERLQVAEGEGTLCAAFIETDDATGLGAAHRAAAAGRPVAAGMAARASSSLRRRPRCFERERCPGLHAGSAWEPCPLGRREPPADPYILAQVGRRGCAMIEVDLAGEPQRQLPPVGGSVDWLSQVGAFEVRPLSPADHPAYCAFAAKLEHEDLRLRFAGLIKIDCEVLRAQLIALDHTQAEALAGFAGGEMLAIAHLVRTTPDTAEFALIVRSDLKRRGLGRVMIGRLVEQACRLGLRTITAEILTENMPMLRLAREAGFHATGRSGLFIDMARETGCADSMSTVPTNPA